MKPTVETVYETLTCAYYEYRNHKRTFTAVEKHMLNPPAPATCTRRNTQDEDAPKAEEPSTIERQELRRTKAQRLAAVKGYHLLSQVVRGIPVLLLEANICVLVGVDGEHGGNRDISLLSSGETPSGESSYCGMATR